MLCPSISNWSIVKFAEPQGRFKSKEHATLWSCDNQKQSVTRTMLEDVWQAVLVPLG